MLLQYRYRVCRENRRDSAGTVMWARDVCKPVAARAVSVSLGRPSVRPPTISLRSLSRTAPARPPSHSLRLSRARAPDSSRLSRSVVAAVRHLRSHSDSLEPPPPPRAVPTVSFAVCAIPSDQSDRSCRRVRSRVGCRFRRRRYYLRYLFFFFFDRSSSPFVVVVCRRKSLDLNRFRAIKKNKNSVSSLRQRCV